MLTSTFNYLCTNFNKKPGSPDLKDKYQQFADRFGRVDHDVFDRAINLLCDTEDFFPKISTVLRYLEKVRPNTGDEFKYCARCKGRGRVGLILAIKKHRDKDETLTGRRSIVHRERWDIDRSREIHADPKMAKHYEDPDTYISDQSAFCLCEKGKAHYDLCGANGLKLSQQEFMVK